MNPASKLITTKPNFFKSTSFSPKISPKISGNFWLIFNFFNQPKNQKS